MVEKLSCYCLSIFNKGNVFVIAGSFSDAVKVYLKSVPSVDESVILSIQKQIKEVLV